MQIKEKKNMYVVEPGTAGHDVIKKEMEKRGISQEEETVFTVDAWRLLRAGLGVPEINFPYIIPGGVACLVVDDVWGGKLEEISLKQCGHEKDLQRPAIPGVLIGWIFKDGQFTMPGGGCNYIVLVEHGKIAVIGLESLYQAAIREVLEEINGELGKEIADSMTDSMRIEEPDITYIQDEWFHKYPNGQLVVPGSGICRVDMGKVVNYSDLCEMIKGGVGSEEGILVFLSIETAQRIGEEKFFGLHYRFLIDHKIY